MNRNQGHILENSGSKKPDPCFMLRRVVVHIKMRLFKPWLRAKDFYKDIKKPGTIKDFCERVSFSRAVVKDLSGVIFLRFLFDKLKIGSREKHDSIYDDNLRAKETLKCFFLISRAI